MKLLIAVMLLLPAICRAQAPDAAESIGSSRNARVAYPMPAEPGERAKVKLVFLAGEIPEEQRAEMQRLAPNVRLIDGLTRETALEYAAEANAVDARVLSPALLERAKGLIWVQALSAGVDRLVSMRGVSGNERLVLTNMRAVHGPAIADHAMAMLLTLTRGMRPLGAAQTEGKWVRDTPGPRPIALQGKTMLVVGIGGIGTEIAKRAHGFGMRVIATRRTDAPAPEFVEKVGKPGDLLKMLPDADVVAICVPLTPETEHLFGKDALAALKQGAYLINIARGKIVDTDELMAALKSGRLAGACLDVTDPEPLPQGHPLWKMDNVVITPHVAADAEVTDERMWVLLRENVRRFGAGEPLLNTVDLKAGY